jgi:hypothetical protein
MLVDRDSDSDSDYTPKAKMIREIESHRVGDREARAEIVESAQVQRGRIQLASAREPVEGYTRDEGMIDTKIW